MFQLLKKFANSAIKFASSVKDSAISRAKFLLVQERWAFKERYNIFTYLTGKVMTILFCPVMLGIDTLRKIDKMNLSELILALAAFGLTAATGIENPYVLYCVFATLVTPIVLSDTGSNFLQGLYYNNCEDIMDIIRTDFPIDMNVQLPVNILTARNWIDSDLKRFTGQRTFLRSALLDFADSNKKSIRTTWDLHMAEQLANINMPPEISNLILWKATDKAFKDTYPDGTSIPEIETLRKEEISRAISKYRKTL